MMKIGILQCDDVRSSLSAEYGEYPDMITAGLAQQHADFSFQTYKTHHGILPECIEECDAYIITGSRYSVLDSEVLWINGLMNFVLRLAKAKIKIIGICFGHQLLAEAMGGKVERADCGWLVGAHEITIQTPQDYMQPEKSHCQLAMLCEDQVQKISKEATVLATSPKCEYAMLQYNGHILSVQGHPEFSAEFAKDLLNVRQDEFPSKRYERGSQSLSEQTLDGELIFRWFTHFLLADSTADLAAN